MVSRKMDSDVIRAWSLFPFTCFPPAGGLKGKMEIDSSLQAGTQARGDLLVQLGLWTSFPPCWSFHLSICTL